MNERGAATPVLLGVAAVVLLLSVGVADVGIVLAARLQAAAAADAAALAAAPVTFLPFGARGSPIAEAQIFATANGARLVSCRCEIDRSWELRLVTVRVARTAHLIGLGTVDVEATSRAEFDPIRLLGD